MKLFKDIFARIWAVWAAAWFVITMLVFFLPFCCCFFWKDPKRAYCSYILYKIWMAIYLPLVGVFVKVKGKEHFKKGANYVIISNHRTLMDIPVSATRIKGAAKTIAKIELSRIPIFGIPYRLGAVLVNRKDKDSRQQSYLQMKTVLESGLHMCIYPEGTRNKTELPLTEFHNGAFKLAVDTQKQLLPAILFNTSKVLSNTRFFYFLPGRIEFHFLPPVEPGNDAVAIKERLFKLMWDYQEINR